MLSKGVKDGSRQKPGTERGRRELQGQAIQQIPSGERQKQAETEKERARPAQGGGGRHGRGPAPRATRPCTEAPEREKEGRRIQPAQPQTGSTAVGRATRQPGVHGRAQEMEEKT